MWGIKGELGLSPIRPGLIHEKKVAANGDVIFDVTYTIENDLSRKVTSPQSAPLVAFDGGTAVIADQAALTWQFFRVEVPADPNLLGWDISIQYIVRALVLTGAVIFDVQTRKGAK